MNLTSAFKEVIKAAGKAANALTALLMTYRMMSRPDQSFPVLFCNTITHPQPKTQPWLSAQKRVGKGFKSQKVRSNNRKAKKKSQLRCSST